MVGVLTVGCGGGSVHAARSAPTTPTSVASTTTTTIGSTTTTVDATKAAILAAYRAEWADFLAVAETFPVQPLDPRLAAHASGKQLTHIQQFLTALSLKSHFGEGTVDLSPSVTSVTADTAIVTDCFFDHTVEADGRTRTPVEQPDTGHTLGQATLKLTGAGWQVADTTTIKSGKDQDSCAPTD
jgi:hypothetical protein